jgi:hypothetical protein
LDVWRRQQIVPIYTMLALRRAGAPSVAVLEGASASCPIYSQTGWVLLTGCEIEFIQR